MNLHTKILVLSLGAATVGAYACSPGPQTKTQYEPETVVPGGGQGGPPVVDLPPPVGASDKSDVVPADGAPAPTKDVEDVLAKLPKGADQLAVVCARNVQNAVTRALCKKPTIGGLADLQAAVGLGFDKKNGGDPNFILQGNSSSLVARFVSAANPRAIVFDNFSDNDTKGYTVMGFTRGDQFVELAGYDKTEDKLTFYLVKFEQACTKTGSCLPADLVTPRIEKNWTGWSLYQDEDVKNTVFDCRQCHQPGGPNTKFLLRFQELRFPWTHTIAKNTGGGKALMDDFRRVHGDNEAYGPIPADKIDRSNGQNLENFVRGAGFGDQPNEFDTGKIESQVKDSERKQPEINDPPGTSKKWDEAFDASFRGEFIPPPYHDVKVTSEPLLASAAAAYKGFIAGTVPDDKMPDIRAIFITKAMEDTSIMPRPGLDGKGVLTQMCQQCHNPKLDQSLTRARFDVSKLDTMPKEEKDLAIARMKLPRTAAAHMPPAMFKDLRQNELDLAVGTLSK